MVPLRPCCKTVLQVVTSYPEVLQEFEKLSLEKHPELNQDLAEDPSILRLGEDEIERRQHRAGRLDLLLQNAEANAEADRRYEVEIQLGATDESHIIRTIEYWDIERKRYPRYDHIAVIVAEEVTSRFLNVVSLFNGMIPLMAIQMNALRIGNQVGLEFTTVVDQLVLGDEDEEIQEPAIEHIGRVGQAKRLLQWQMNVLNWRSSAIVGIEIQQARYHSGEKWQAQPFYRDYSQEKFCPLKPEIKKLSGNNRTDGKRRSNVMDYHRRTGRYRIRLKPGEIERNKEILVQIIKEAYEENAGNYEGNAGE